MGQIYQSQVYNDVTKIAITCVDENTSHVYNDMTKIPVTHVQSCYEYTSRMYTTMWEKVPTFES